MRRIALYAVLLLLPIFHSACTPEDNPQQGQVPGGSGNGNKEDTVDWQAVADESSQSLLDNYWNKSRLFFNKSPFQTSANAENGGYWWQAHSMDVIIDAYVRTGDSHWKDYFSQWYTGVKATNGGSYFKSSVDTMGWICLTMLRLYEHTGEKQYLSTAESLWARITASWNEYGGGGIPWRDTEEYKYSKNACSNGPAGIIAAYMYRLNGQKQSDYDWLVKMYEWQTRYLVSSQGAVYDSLDASTNPPKVNTNWIFSYNQGTYIGMAHELYLLSGGTRTDCLSMAVKAANYTMNNLAVNGIMKPNGLGDGGLFNGIFIRYFTKLIQDEAIAAGTRQIFKDFLDRNATVLHIRGTDKNNNLYSNDWTVPGNTDSGNTELGVQVSGCTLIEAKALLEK